MGGAFLTHCITVQHTNACTYNSRPAQRKCHCSNTFRIKMSFLFLYEFMITATQTANTVQALLTVILLNVTKMQQQQIDAK